jgi:hypothetical protein
LDWLCNCLNCEHDVKLWKLIEALLINCGWIFPFKEICIVCDRPIQISFDSERHLHAEGEPALKFADGFRLFVHHGVQLPEPFRGISPKQWKAEWYTETKNRLIRKALLENLPFNMLSKSWIAWDSDLELKKSVVDRLGIQLQSLSNNQINALESYRQKWQAIALQTTRIDRQNASLAIEEFYAIEQSCTAPRLHKPEVLFADGLYSGGRLVKQIHRGQLAKQARRGGLPLNRAWCCNPYGYFLPYRGVFNSSSRGEFLNSHLMNRLWQTIGVQLGDNLFQELLKTLIVKRSWSLEPVPGWIQPESLTAWCSLFDFCISVLDCVHDSDLWLVLQSVVIECGWFYPYRKTCIVCDRPVKLSVDDQDRLHDSKEAAIVYADGYRLKAMHGLSPKKSRARG